MIIARTIAASKTVSINNKMTGFTPTFTMSPSRVFIPIAAMDVTSNQCDNEFAAFVTTAGIAKMLLMATNTIKATTNMGNKGGRSCDSETCRLLRVK